MEYVGLIMLVTPHIIAIGIGKITPEWWRMVYIIYVIVAVVFALKGAGIG